LSFIRNRIASETRYMSLRVLPTAAAAIFDIERLLCSEPSWVSARVRSHYRKGLKGPFGSPVFACAREDRSSISFLILSQTSAGKAFQLFELNHAA
jgi:hypothetical protein